MEILNEEITNCLRDLIVDSTIIGNFIAAAGSQMHSFESLPIFDYSLYQKENHGEWVF